MGPVPSLLIVESRWEWDFNPRYQTTCLLETPPVLGTKGTRTPVGGGGGFCRKNRFWGRWTFSDLFRPFFNVFHVLFLGGLRKSPKTKSFLV